METKKIYLGFKKIINDFSESKKQTVSGFNATQKFLFNSFHLLLSLYITLTQFSLVIFDLIPHVLLAVSSVVLFFVVYIGLFYLCDAIGKISIYYTPERKKFDFKFALIVFLVVEAVVMLLFLAEFPGTTNTDFESQWKQIETLTIDDWHPAIHTLTMLLITTVVDSYAAVIFVQFVLFGVGVSYLLTTLEAWGISRKLLYAVLALTVVNQNNHIILTIALKDTALSLTLLFLATHLINIYLSEGEWLKRKSNIFGFSLLLTYATLVRHNAMLFTFSALAVLLLLFKKQTKQVIACVVIIIALIGFVRGPLYSVFDVRSVEYQTSSEIIGLPMTILGDIMVTNANALTLEAKEFLNVATSDQGWIDLYTKGSFNSIKFSPDVLHIWLYTDALDITKMAIQSSLNATTIAVDAVIELTDMVWKTTDVPEGRLTFDTFSKSHEIVTTHAKLPETVQVTAQNLYNAVFAFVPNFVQEALSFLGIHFLMIMVFGFFACKQKGMKALLLVLPIILYNIGTMVVLCGNDYRFFHFNLLLSAPFVVVFLAKQKPQ